MINSREFVDLGAQNTLSLPCIARRVVSVHSVDTLQTVCAEHTLKSSDLLILGRGSNLLLPPKLDRVVLQYSGQACRYTTTDSGDVLLEADAGLLWDDLVIEAVTHGLRGIENLSLIPGTVGAAPVQNIGAYGVELATRLEWVQVYHFATAKVERLDAKQCRFAYRDSLFKQRPGERLILTVCLRLSEQKPFSLNYGELRALDGIQTLTARDVRDKVIAMRRAKLPDPATLANAGSFFKNPVVSSQQLAILKSKFPSLVAFSLADGTFKLAAGWLIDQAGWKGFRRGAVGVHAQQALVLVNYGGATRANLLDLAVDIQDSIQKKFDVALEIEPVLVD